MVNVDFEKFKEVQKKHKSIYLGRNQDDEGKSVIVDETSDSQRNMDIKEK